MTDTLDTLIDRAARGVLLHSEGPALRAAVATLQRHLTAEHQTSALRAGIANDLRVQLRAAEDELARLRPLPAQLAAARAVVAKLRAEEAHGGRYDGLQQAADDIEEALDGTADPHPPAS